jgi:hypothetical protein
MTLARLRSTSPPRLLRRLLALFVALASLQLAVVLISLEAGVVAWATFIERTHGAAAAHFAIYDTGWFTAIGGLLAANVLSAVLIRFPWRRRQTGFVVTHAGILVLLAGCLVSQRYGIEAQLPIFEGHTAHRALQESSHFELQVAPASPSSEAASAAKPTEVILVPFVAGPFSWNQYATLSWFPWLVAHRSRGILYDEDGIALEVLDYQAQPKSSAKLRLTVDGVAKEFDVATSSGDASEGTRRQAVEGKGRQVTVSMRPDEVDLGFQLYLHKFQRKLDPGGGMASHYSSLIDFLDLGNPPQKLQTNVLITLNAPVDFADSRAGCTFRLFQASFEPPWMPGDPEFDQLVDKDRSRDQVFLSRLSVNCDPGRGLKYAGSLLIVAGIIMVYYLRAYFARKENNETSAA